MKSPREEETPPAIQPGLTWTMSQEEDFEVDVDVVQSEVPSVVEDASSIVAVSSIATEEKEEDAELPSKKEKTITFTESELAQNQLNHMLEMVKKQEELEQMRDYHTKAIEHMKKEAASREEQIREFYSKTIDGLREETMVQIEKWYKQVMEDMAQTLASVENELKETRARLRSAEKESEKRKADMRLVSATLMETQAALFEQQQRQEQQVSWSSISTWVTGQGGDDNEVDC